MSKTLQQLSLDQLFEYDIENFMEYSKRMGVEFPLPNVYIEIDLNLDNRISSNNIVFFVVQTNYKDFDIVYDNEEGDYGEDLGKIHVGNLDDLYCREMSNDNKEKLFNFFTSENVLDYIKEIDNSNDYNEIVTLCLELLTIVNQITGPIKGARIEIQEGQKNMNFEIKN